MTGTRSFIVLRTLCVLAVVLFAATGCEDAVETPAVFAPTYPQLAPIAPPVPPYEKPPVLDDPRTMIWRPGYWSYNGNSFDWVAGEIMARPDPTAAWFPSYWTKHTYGWAFVPGYWQ